MKAFVGIRLYVSSTGVQVGRRGGALPSSRTRISFPVKVVFCCAKFEADSEVDEVLNTTIVPPMLLVAEKEEAKAVLTLFLKKQGLSNAITARTINKSDLFIDHLVSRLHYVHKSRYLVGRELTTLEIREALISYLESLLEEHGSLIRNVVENFPNPPDVKENFPNPPAKEKPLVQAPPPQAALDYKKLEGMLASPHEVTLNSKKLKAVSTSPPQVNLDSKTLKEESTSPPLDSKMLKAVSRVSEIGPAGQLPPHILYLMDQGLDLEQIKGITRRFPAFAYYSLGKIKPSVEFLLELGISKSDLRIILTKRPQLCGISLSENLIPTMAFLENLGVDKNQWAKVIYRFPALLTYSRQKVKISVNFFKEMGLSAESIGKVLTRCPGIISYSIEDKLRPTAEYFRSLGVDIALLLHRCPQCFGLSIEGNLKPVTEFFLEKGYSLEEVGTMISRYAALYTFSLAENIIPKWNFFLTMDYPKEELVKFPQFFGYSLEERIKPRYALVKESGVRLLLNLMLSSSYKDFEEALKKKKEKMLLDAALNDTINDVNLQPGTEQ